MQPRFLIEARIVETRDFMFLYKHILILIPLSTRIIILNPPCSRNIENMKRRSLGWILRRAKVGGCIVSEQTNFDILKNPLYIVHLTEEDLEKMIGEDKTLIEEIYNDKINTRKCGGSDVRGWSQF